MPTAVAEVHMGGGGASEFVLIELVCLQRWGVVVLLCLHRSRFSAGAPLKSTSLQCMRHAWRSDNYQFSSN